MNPNENPPQTDRIWITAGQVLARYGDISAMTLWRWVRDPKMGFPKPVYLNRRRYWDLDALDAFDANLRELAA